MAAKGSGESNNSSCRAYIGLGSNEGDRVGFVQQAMQLFKDVPGITVVECSSLYETEPTDGRYREWFVNAVAAIETSLSAEDLLDICKDIQNRLEELHGAPHAPEGGERRRIIDLDILFFGDLLIATEELTLPHPALARRAYALVPLLEIAPDIRHPGNGKTIGELHEELPEPELVFLYGTRSSDDSF